MSTALFVDTYSRQIEVSTVSVSQVSGKGLVLRYGAKVGNLWQLTENNHKLFRNNDLPIIISTRGYQARSSAGFVDVLDCSHTVFRTRVVGIQGMPFQIHKGLSVMSNPMDVLVLRPGTNIAMLDTHARRKAGEGWHSNPATAEAAIRGIKLRAQIRHNSVFIFEGQSDYVQGWELATEYYDDGLEPFAPEFPQEFRGYKFDDESFVVAALRRYARKSTNRELSKDEIDGRIFIWANIIIAGQSTQGIIPESTLAMVGSEERIRQIAGSLAYGMRQKDWTLGVDLSVGNRFLQAISPRGEVATKGYALFSFDAPVKKNLISVLDALTDEERECVREKEEVILQ